jgi:DNA-binding NarL/FixJ family response regulator
MAILSAHASPELAVRDGYRIPEGTVYAVKSEIAGAADLVTLVQAAVERRVVRESDAIGDRIVISQVHGEILRMIAEGLSNAAIAKERNTSLRAAEGMVQRTFVALGIGSDADRNARVLAVRMWQQGKVIIR